MSVETSKTDRLDRTHVAVEEPGPDPLTETQDGEGPYDGHTQGGPEPEKGGENERITKQGRVTLGRHISSESGEIVRSRRHKAFRSAKREGEIVFARKKK